MTPDRVARLLVELVNLDSETAPVEEDPRREARVLFANREVAFVHVTLAGDRTFEVTVREIKYPRILRQEKSMYRKAKVPQRSVLREVQWCLGTRTPTAVVVHVRGTLLNGAFFAGAVVLNGDRAVCDHDLECQGPPVDDEELAVAIDEALGSSAAVRRQVRRILE
jgi:hypothetical protein